MSATPDLAKHMGAVARRLLGEPNKDQSSRKELRFGRHGSVAVDLAKGTFYDHENKSGGGVLDLIARVTGRANGAAVDWLREELGIQTGGEWPRQGGRRRLVATYPYVDEHGELRFEVCRYEPKDFSQRRPDGRGGYINNLQGVEALPYRLPSLAAAEVVYIAEGEKDADNLVRLGLVATCNPGGAGKWPDGFARHFVGKAVVILPDNDPIGRDHARAVAASLAPVAASVKILELPGLPPKGDASDWIAAGGTAERLAELAAAAPAWRQPDAEPAEGGAQPWPAPLAPEAFHGLVGKIVRQIEPESEADPAALLFQLLAGVGNILGAGGFVRVGDDRHPPRLFVVQVGRTSKGRKGTSWGRIRSLLQTVAPEWASSRLASGLSSGEGVIHEVRDPVSRRETDKKTGEAREVVADAGVEDKRLLVFEGELVKALRSMERQGNTLSAVLRDAWDHGDLRTLVKNDPNRATGAHVSVIGHITADELRRYLDRTEAANGLANRFLFVCVQRSKLLPRGGRRIEWAPIAEELRARLATAASIGEVGRTEAAWRVWEAVYAKLSEDRPGLLGAVLGRAEAQVLRLALIYALLDGQAFIDAPHLLAALACWDYGEASARYIFGGTLGDPIADEVLRLLRGSRAGATRTEISNHFGRHRGGEEIGRALAVLARENLACRSVEETGGRPVERWRTRP
jgi:hypothetical protein